MEEIKVFLDSNILFSMAYTGKDRSRSYLIYELQDLKALKVYLSKLVCEEALLNIRNKKPASLPFLRELIGRSTVLVDIKADLKHQQVSRLPVNDRGILSTAVYHKMDFFITGNDKDFHMFYHKKVGDTIILKPADFLDRQFL